MVENRMLERRRKKGRRVEESMRKVEINEREKVGEIEMERNLERYRGEIDRDRFLSA